MPLRILFKKLTLTLSFNATFQFNLKSIINDRKYIIY